MPINWPEFRKALRSELSGKIDDQQRIRIIAQDVGLSAANVNFHDAPLVVWHSLIDYAMTQQAVPDLIREAQQWLPKNQALASLAQQWTSEEVGKGDGSGPPALKPVPIPDSTLEKQMGPTPTFLPSAFLEAGALAVPSVVRIRTPGFLGTGFLIAADILLTNHHVIGSIKTAEASEVDFDYQANIDGTYVHHTASKLDPSPSRFHTSEEHDVTAVGLHMPDGLKRTPLRLSDEPAQVNDRVAIIQHPEGGRKQVALHRNFVLYADDQILQYLTDTLPGSSGSPIFDSRWRIVGIHHSGGQIPEPNTQILVYRNQGTSLRALKSLLTQWNVLP